MFLKFTVVAVVIACASSAAFGSTPVARPFAEYENVKHLILGTPFSIWDMHKQIAADLPNGVNLLVAYVPDSDAVSYDAIMEAFTPYLSPDRIQTVALNWDGRNVSWARDAMPIPVIGTDGSMVLNAAQYKLGEVDYLSLAKFFQAPVIEHGYYQEGGNFEADRNGNCFTVSKSPYMTNSDLISDESFQTDYGCKTITRLKYYQGIGHVDEVLRVVSDSVALTTVPEYEPVLRALGFDVRMLPSSGVKLGSYANSILLNGTAIVPTFNVPNDAVAEEVYRAAGFKVMAMDGKKLAEMEGGPHCISMTYPE
jgi:agmatine/peptidylarginine deiminase